MHTLITRDGREYTSPVYLTDCIVDNTCRMFKITRYRLSCAKFERLKIPAMTQYGVWETGPQVLRRRLVSVRSCHSANRND